MGSESFDYVIVGGGSAGAVIANRLSEDPATRVLLLEAGPEPEADEITIPAAFTTLFKTKWDWNYTTTAQKQLDGRPTYWPRMKALGGCSSMNAMIYMRGNRLDYDTWRDEFGCAGWGYDDVLPYFVKAEDNQSIHDKYHGNAGPLWVEDRRYTFPLTTAWVESAVASGLKRNDDFNGASQDGAGLYQVTCKKGKRWSTWKAYLEPVRKRPNLTIKTGALATRVVLDGTRATGVGYVTGRDEHTAYADREVILSGGAINSPQLLLLSGIGPANHLREMDIDVVVDLPGVGENLHDHPAVPIIWRTKGADDPAAMQNMVNLGKALVGGRGPLSSNIGEGGGFFASRDDLAAPDIQIHVAPTSFYNNGLNEPNVRSVTTAPTLVNVASRGTLRLRSKDPRWAPAMDPAYYDDQTDLDAMLAGCRRAIDIARSGPFASYLAGAARPASSDPSDEELIAHIRTYTQTLYHPVGTCSMGDGEDAVVDPSLKVRGVENLRIADASVMPMVPRGNTNAPTIMVGEKAADLIRSAKEA